jgi:hypothetical protein
MTSRLLPAPRARTTSRTATRRRSASSSRTASATPPRCMCSRRG